MNLFNLNVYVALKCIEQTRHWEEITNTCKYRKNALTHILWAHIQYYIPVGMSLCRCVTPLPVSRRVFTHAGRGTPPIPEVVSRTDWGGWVFHATCTGMGYVEYILHFIVFSNIYQFIVNFMFNIMLMRLLKHFIC